MKISTEKFLEELRKKPKLCVEKKAKSWLSVDQISLQANVTERRARHALSMLHRQGKIETKRFVIETGVTGVHRGVDHFRLKKGSNLPKVVKELKLTW